MDSLSLSILSNSNTLTANNVENSLNIIGEANDKALLSLLSNLSNHDTIIGTIISSDGNEYSFKTPDGVTVNAKVNDGVSLSKGATVLFEVNKTSNNETLLRPLNVNTNNAKTATLALKQAGIPVNSRSVETILRNMEYGRPIDRNSLAESYRDVSLNESYPVKDIVDLQTMDIPRTEANLKSYEAYRNMENLVTESFTDIADSLAEDFLNLSLNEEVSSQTIDANKTLALENGIDLVNNVKTLVEGNESKLLAPNGESVNLQSAGLNDESGNLNSAVSNDGSGDSKASLSDTVTALAGKETLSGPDNAESKLEKALATLLNVQDSESSENVLKDVFSALKDMLSKDSVKADETFNSQVKSEAGIDLNKGSLLKQTSEETGINKETLSLLSEDGLKELKEKVSKSLQKAFNEHLTLSKEDMSDKKEVRNLYKNLFETAHKLSDTLQDILPKDSKSVAYVNNLNQNLDFMNALNNFIPYVQIPFKGENGAKAGELYVYRGNKSLAEGDSEVTAFVHMDTKNLGPADIYVSLTGSNVSTNFTLADEDSLLFIEKNLSLLDKRLTEKGYSFKGEVKLSSDTKSSFEKVLDENLSKLVIADTSFDARV